MKDQGKVKKPENLSPEASSFWDEHADTMQAIMDTYLHIAGTQDLEGFKMLNAYISMCSQSCVHLMKATAGRTQ